MERSYESARALVCEAEGPLSPHLEAFVSSLIEQRYSAWCVYLKSYRAANFSSWLALQVSDARDVDERAIARYHRERSRGRHRPWRNELHALHQLLTFLREHGVINDPAAAAAVVPADYFVRRYEEHLHHVRGLATRTISVYAAFARQFLIARFGRGAVDLHDCALPTRSSSCSARRSAWRPRRLKLSSTALRSFLRYAQIPRRGRARARRPPCRRSPSGTTRRIAQGHRGRACACGDRSLRPRTAVGRRDRAVLLLLARLGLRARRGRSAHARGVDWDAGRLRVRGKGGAREPAAAAGRCREAIAAYLQHGRPTCDDRHLFLRSRRRSAVSCRLGTPSARSCARLQRAGVDAPHKGAHQFRHALAVQHAARRRFAAPRSASCCATAARSPQPCTPRWTSALARLGPGLAGRCAMNTLAKALHEYLELRRGLGFKLQRRRLAAAAVRELHGSNTTPSTSPRGWRWSGRKQSATVQPAEWARRLGFVRGFARYRSATDAATEIPPPGCCRTARPAPRPYLYTEQEIERLLDAALQLPTAWPSTPLRPWVFHCLLGLLSVTGLRISEALNLQARRRRSRPGAVLTIRGAKLGQERLVPIHRSPCAVLADYLRATRTVLRSRASRRTSSSPTRQPARQRPRAPNVLRAVAADGAARHGASKGPGCTTSGIASPSRH